MSLEEDWWWEAVKAIPGPWDEPLTAPDILDRFHPPKPSLAWLKKYLRELAAMNDVEMLACRGIGMNGVDRWLHFRWLNGFGRPEPGDAS